MTQIRKNLFTHTLSHLEYGRTTDEIDIALNGCIKAAQETGKQATLTITLSIKPKNYGDQVFITPDIKVKIPKLPREETIFFPVDGNLLRNDPRQESIPNMHIAEEIVKKELKTA